MKTISYKEFETSKNPHGVEAKKIHENTHAQVVHILLNPGERLKKHTTPVDVFFYVLEGDGIVEIGDEKEKVFKDMLIDKTRSHTHTFSNTPGFCQDLRFFERNLLIFKQRPITTNLFLYSNRTL